MPHPTEEQKMPDEIWTTDNSITVNGTGKTIIGMWVDAEPTNGKYTKYIRADTLPAIPQDVREAVEVLTGILGRGDDYCSDDAITHLKTLIAAASVQSAEYGEVELVEIIMKEWRDYRTESEKLAIDAIRALAAAGVVRVKGE